MINKDNIVNRHFGKLISTYDKGGMVYKDWRLSYYNKIGEVVTYDIGNDEKMAFFVMSDDKWLHTSVVEEIFHENNKIYYRTLNSIYEFEVIDNLSNEYQDRLKAKVNLMEFNIGYEKF